MAGSLEATIVELVQRITGRALDRVPNPFARKQVQSVSGRMVTMTDGMTIVRARGVPIAAGDEVHCINTSNDPDKPTYMAIAVPESASAPFPTFGTYWRPTTFAASTQASDQTVSGTSYTVVTGTIVSMAELATIDNGAEWLIDVEWTIAVFSATANVSPYLTLMISTDSGSTWNEATVAKSQGNASNPFTGSGFAIKHIENIGGANEYKTIHSRGVFTIPAGTAGVTRIAAGTKTGTATTMSVELTAGEFTPRLVGFALGRR